MKKAIDWKYWLTLSVTVVGVLATVWIWQSELVSKSLHFEMASQTALQATTSQALKGVKLSVDGVDVVSPFITVLKLAHDGSRPIQSADFEGPIKIIAEHPATVLKAEVTEVNPKDLQPAVHVDGGIISISPLLLNSGDTVTVAVITSGSAPKFSVRSRIAGIPSIKIHDRTGRLFSDGYLAALAILAFLNMVGASTLIGPGFQTIQLRARAALSLAFLVLLPATVTILVVLRSWGIEGWLGFLLIIAASTVVATPVGLWLNRPVAPKADDSSPSAS